MWRIRPVQSHDASGIAAIYAPIVERTIISFEEIPPSAAEMKSRIAHLSGRYPWLVAEQGGDILGYAYAGPHRERAAYRWSVDVSAYVHERARRAGVASSLYRALLTLLEAQGYCHAFAGITMPNDASVALHRSIGFEPVGIYKNVGFKFGAWRDTSWWQRPIAIPQGAPPEPTEFSRLMLPAQPT
jgi:phosphinothricin acetyltransferase